MRIQRKITLPLLLVGLAVAGASFFSTSVYAQTSNTTLDNGSFLGVTPSSNQDPVLQAAGASPNDSTNSSSGNNDSTFGNSLTTIGCLSGNIALCGASVGLSEVGTAIGGAVSSGVSTIGNDILVAVAVAVLAFANWLLGIAGVLFNLIMYYGVFQFGNTVGNSPGVLAAWGILRDLANMALLFGFIFMGIATILDTGAVQSFTAKRALPSLLIFAILMNFSLFTCEAMIDVSNALSATMYSQANTDPCTGDSVVGSATQALTGTSCGINYGLAGHIMQSTGLSGIWAIQGNSPLGAKAASYFGLALFATIGAIVFFAASVMLAIRVVILTLLMVVSPIGFAGMAIPPLRKLAGDWWTRVIHQAFYAPIMLLLILISLKIADSFTSGVNAGSNNGLAAAVLGQDASVMGVFLVFMLVIGFMVASLIAANRFGAVGASAAVGFGKKVVLGTYGGAAGFAGRRTIGAGSNWAQKQYNKSVASGKLQFLAGSTIDDAILGGLKKGQAARFGSSKSFKEHKEHHEARHKDLAKIERLEEINKAKTDTDMRDAVKKLTDGEIAESAALKKGGEQLELIARALSSEKFEKLMNNDKISDDRKDEMRNARFKDLHTAVKEAEDAAKAFEAAPKDKALQDEYNKKQKALFGMANALNNKDIGQLASSTEHSSVFMDPNFAIALSDEQFKDAKKNNNFSASQIQNLETKRTERLNDPVHVLNRISTMSPEQIGKLSGDVLTKRDPTGGFIVLDKIGARQLAAIDPTTLTPQQSSDIDGYIKTVFTRHDKTAEEFKRMYSASPELQRRWP